MEDGSLELGHLTTDELLALFDADDDGLDREAIQETYQARIRAAEALKQSAERLADRYGMDVAGTDEDDAVDRGRD